MNGFEFTKNGLTLTFSQPGKFWNGVNVRVSVTDGKNTHKTQVSYHSPQSVHGRVDFLYIQHQQWLAAAGDTRGWLLDVDVFEPDEVTRARPIDSCAIQMDDETLEAYREWWAGFGLDEPAPEPETAPVSARAENYDEHPGDFSASGLGIGGAGSHDLYAETLELVGRGEMEIVARVCSWGGTRYDERCAVCGRVTAICNDCELCEGCHG